MCNEWMKEQVGCDSRNILQEEVPITTAGGSTPVSPTQWDIPQDCTEMNVQRQGHSNEVFGCEEMYQTVTLCLDINPKCTQINWASSGCRTFGDPELARNYVDEIATRYPDVKITLKANQNLLQYNRFNTSCTQTSYKTYTIDCGIVQPATYESCDSITAKQCTSDMVGESKLCTKADGSIEKRTCCYKGVSLVPEYRSECNP
jgi:hypothetical protein